MALTGSNNAEKIWNFLYAKLGNAYGVAGIMGNFEAESGLRPNNLQNSYEKKLGYTDESYTAAVDNGSYDNFVYDKAGYGLVQYTFWSLKKSVYDYAKSVGKSIGDLEMQLEHICKMLSTDYASSVWNVCKNATSVRQASDAMLLKFERPADQSESVQIKRASYGQNFYDKYAKKTTSNNSNGGITMGYTNSSLVNCTVKSPNHSGTRTHKIDRITPHCVVGQLSAESIGSCFPKGREASCNYGIGYDGRVCLIVDEQNRSWCTSSGANDQRAITIECASDSKEPYAFKQAVYDKLVKLCIDICKRNGLKKVLWIADKNKSLAYNPADGECVLTVHRWFANKSCPGNWMYSRMGQLADDINKGLGATAPTTPAKPINPAPTTPTKPTTPATTYAVGDIVDFKGTTHYASADAKSGVGCKAGKAKVTAVYKTGKHPYHLIAEKDGKSTVYGWVNAADIGGKIAPVKPTTPTKPSGSTTVDYAESYNKAIAGTYKTTDSLNLRCGAGTGKTVLCTMPRGSKVKNYGYYTTYRGVKWYYVSYTDKNGKSWLGFCSSAYLTK